MKKKRTQEKPTTHRASANTPFAAVKSIEEKSLVAICDGFTPKTDAQRVVIGWLGLNEFAPANERLTPEQENFMQLVEASTAHFIRRAMTEWKPDMLRELANEMTARTKNTNWNPDIARWLLLEASKQGPVNVTQLHEHATENKMISISLRAFQGMAKQLGVSTVSPGRPKG